MRNPIILSTLEFKDSNCEVRTASNENEEWWLKCHKNTDETTVEIGMKSKMDGNTREDTNGNGTFCISSIRGSDFGFYFEIYLRDGIPETIFFPPIKIDSLHDGSESEIKCEVYESKERVSRPVLDIMQWNKWYIPSYLLEKKTWNALLMVLLKSDHDPVELGFRLTSFGSLFVQTRKLTSEYIYFLGLFTFCGMIRSSELILKQEAKAKYVCKFEHPIESRPSDSTTVLFEYKVFVSHHVEDYEAVKDLILLQDFRESMHSLYNLENVKLDVKTDVKLEVQGKIFNAHSFLLSARSLKFREILSEPKLEYELKIEDLDVSTVHQMLEFVYSNKMSVTDSDNLKKLYHASDVYKITFMKSELANLLKNKINAANADSFLNWSRGRDEDIEQAVLHFKSER